MNNIRSVLFIQNRTHRAGAQTCLARLLRHEAIRRWNPIVLCSPDGWVVEECGRLGVPVIEEEFPSSRSLPGRLSGNAAFGRRVAAKLMQRSLRPGIVHANDHQEGLLGLEVAERIGAHTAMFLRSSAMTKDDFLKYGCSRYEFVAAVGDKLLERAKRWRPDGDVALIRDGIFPDEFASLQPRIAGPPKRVLVIGSPLASKGWSDLTEALYLLEEEGVLPPTAFDFTGARPDPVENDLRLDRLKSARCSFLGRVEAFRDLLRKYDLVINPSRMETFGMAAVEAVAAGMPLLSSRTGVIEQILEQPDVLFAPAAPHELAVTLKKALLGWSRMDFGTARGQERIRRNFTMDEPAEKLSAAYEALVSGQERAKAQPHPILIAQKFSSLGGSQVSLWHHLKHLDHARFAPHVVVSNEGWLTERLDELNVPWTRMKFGHWTNPLSIPANLLLILRLLRLIRRHRIELVHANEHWVGPPAYCAARLAGIPAICHFRTGLNDLTPKRIRKYLYGRFDRVLPVAEVLQKALVAHVADASRVVVVRDGVEPPAAILPARKKRSGRRRIVLNVGALYEVKGQAKILALALPWLKASRHHYLVFVGGTRTAPSYVDGMKEVVRREGLERQVLFLGSRNDVARLLRIADALVAYSSVEGVPMVVMEAMFAALPVIVSNTPGMEEVVADHDNGRVLDFDDEDNPLAEALFDMSSERARWQAMGWRGYELAKEKHSIQAMSNAIQSVYDELL